MFHSEILTNITGITIPWTNDVIGLSLKGSRNGFELNDAFIIDVIGLSLKGSRNVGRLPVWIRNAVIGLYL